jgi:hypothetical protein
MVGPRIYDPQPEGPDARLNQCERLGLRSRKKGMEEMYIVCAQKAGQGGTLIRLRRERGQKTNPGMAKTVG